MNIFAVAGNTTVITAEAPSSETVTLSMSPPDTVNSASSANTYPSSAMRVTVAVYTVSAAKAVSASGDHATSPVKFVPVTDVSGSSPVAGAVTATSTVPVISVTSPGRRAAVWYIFTYSRVPL